MKRYIRIPLALTALGLAGLLAAVTLVAGAYFYLAPSLPQTDELQDVRLQVPLSVYSRDGRMIAQIGEHRRDPVALENVPDRLVQAFLAAEDQRFFEHPGFDYRGIARAALGLLATGSHSRGGGSTITQQLARNFYLSPEITFSRKARELFLAIRIEQELSKEEILELYLNKIFLGQRAYGVAAAARVYFGKSLHELELAEMATIAGLPSGPSIDNPVRSPQRAEVRRNYVLRRMLEVGHIDQGEHDRARSQPMLSRLHGPRLELHAPYVAELARQEMVSRYGAEVYDSGFRVITTVDSRLQRASDDALRRSLLDYDRRHGWRGPVERLGAEALSAQPGAPDDDHYLRLLGNYRAYGSLQLALVLDTPEREALVYVPGSGAVTVPWAGISWARNYINENARGPAPQRAADVVQPGDVVYVTHEDEQWLLAQVPQAQGALVALDPLDGAVTSLSGGFDYALSTFNRVTQARRQPGSAFKPFIFSAALEHGFTAASIVNDAPLVFENSELQPAWRPENYTRQWYGPTRLREALVRSLNLVSVRVLLEAGLDNTIAHLRPFGFGPAALPRDPTLALGSGGATPMEMTRGYAVFANGGYRVEPYLIERIEDGAGNVLFEAAPSRLPCAYCEPQASPETWPGVAFNEHASVPDRTRRVAGSPALSSPGWQQAALDADSGALQVPPLPPAPERIISAPNAWIINDMMLDVVRRGTAVRAYNELGRRNDLAGKTGTSNEQRDTWFAGYSNGLVATAWVGFDQERSLGAQEQGGRTALPMWIDFMRAALAGTQVELPQRPPGLVEVRINPQTGQVTSAGSAGSVFEIFESGRVPPAEEGSGGSRPDQNREQYDTRGIF